MSRHHRTRRSPQSIPPGPSESPPLHPQRASRIPYPCRHACSSPPDLYTSRPPCLHSSIPLRLHAFVFQSSRPPDLNRHTSSAPPELQSFIIGSAPPALYCFHAYCFLFDPSSAP